ncbi:MAG: disulfide bond formation protein B [Pelagimonas sp.]|uniref:disulfide bond formation protein B n=1 Tax=Pelagimonas sp. TaxID=2073170 RepID=UPI003D6B8AF1
MRRTLILLATIGCTGLILGAYGFQYLGDMPPCAMCWWQRYGHFAAIAFGVLGLFVLPRIMAFLAGLGALSSGVIAIYHSGVERKIWEGPDTCTSNPVGNLTPEQLLEQIMAAPLVRCDEIPWEMFGLSMANYNVFASLVLAAVFFFAARLPR